MKTLFFSIAIVLSLASIGTVLSYPDRRSPVPVLYWVTGRNPAREMQVALFHQWLIDQGLVTEAGRPIMELRIDASNNDMTKKVVQGVSGVGGDIIDVYSGGVRLRYFQSMGMLRDLTEAGIEHGFSPAKTFAAIEPEITVDGRQYSFPSNVYALMYWVNQTTFERYGIEPPPRRWTLEQFESIGKRFVAAANTPAARAADGLRGRVFFADQVDLRVMHRSLGLSMFNETLTACTLDDERFVRCLSLLYQWMYEDRLVPSKSDASSFEASGSNTAVKAQLFAGGRYGLQYTGLWLLTSLREMPTFDTVIVEPPNGGFPNVYMGTRAASIYMGSEYPELAYHFLRFLASEAYNMQVVHDTDGLPPNPLYTRTEAFLRPPAYPNEWDLHAPFAQAAQTIGIGGVYSPFVMPMVARRHFLDAMNAVLNDLKTPRQAAADVTHRINAEIARRLDENPALRPRYEALVERQARIDALREVGRPVPLEMIDNIFYRRLYLYKAEHENQSDGDPS